MKTTKPMATISYNTETFLEMRLSDLVNNGVLETWYYIKHKGEQGDKDHIHLLMYPAKSVDTVWLRNQFTEQDPNNVKPLGCMVVQKCLSDEDMMSYSTHDVTYLEIKGEEKEYHYKPEDWKSNDPYAVQKIEEAIKEKTKGFYPLSTLTRMVLSGITVRDLVTQNHINPRDLHAMKEFETEAKGENHDKLKYLDKIDKLREVVKAQQEIIEQLQNNQLPEEWRE